MERAEPGDALLLSLVLRVARRAACRSGPRSPWPRASLSRAQIKWPNDVWLGGRKVSGILVEGRPQEGWAVLGIGLNVATRSFPDELSEIATSLALAGASLSREEVLDALLASLDRLLAAAPAEVLAAWREARRSARAPRSPGTEGGVGQRASPRRARCWSRPTRASWSSTPARST